MTIRQIQMFQGVQSDHARLVAQVEDFSEATHNLQDAVEEKATAMVDFNPFDPASQRTLAMLEQRAELFEVQAKLATQCAKGLRLAQEAVNLTSSLPDEETAQWIRETYFLVSAWFTKEQRDEWYFAGKEVVEYAETYAENSESLRSRFHAKEVEKVAMYNRGIALIMNAQVAALEKLSNDLVTRMNSIKETRSSD